jgi:hypothetical protein
VIYGSEAALYNQIQDHQHQIDDLYQSVGNIAAAIQELDDEKAPLASPTFTGTVTVPATIAAAGQATSITLIDNNAAALNITEAANSYLKFITTNGGEKIEMGKALTVKTNAIIDSDGSNAYYKSGGLIYLEANAHTAGRFGKSSNIIIEPSAGYYTELKGSGIICAGVIISTGTYANTVGATNRDLYIDNSGYLGYVSSSKRYKENIRSLHEKSSLLLKLNPILFDYIDKSKGVNQFGLIAEDVAEILPEIVSYNDDGSVETVSYSKLVPLLLDAHIEQSKTIADLQRQLDEQRLAVAELANQVNSFKLLLSEVLEKYRFMVEEMDKVSKYKKKG